MRATQSHPRSSYRVVADGAVFDPTQALLLGKDVRNLEIDYTAVSLVIPERVMFKYRLVGHDPDWLDVGSRRSAFYTDLRPGRYEFRVIASNNDGVWNEVGKQLTLNCRPTCSKPSGFARCARRPPQGS